ncbi:hypothetical protein RHSIM_Rhsim03G0109500 [Rhododendron simsii]|uniref:Uncharacterized protein n=1 Tax=Rhododendron simsii TaxID=118357 RepID=A0A834H949_RHOSS|nr:hypothetical protein RHSIM_Rhsim03G0109500 [Rhododendron simsii]
MVPCLLSSHYCLDVSIVSKAWVGPFGFYSGMDQKLVQFVLWTMSYNMVAMISMWPMSSILVIFFVMDTWTLLLCIIILCYVANLAFVFWSIYKVHDEAKDKAFEFEMSWVCDESKRQRKKLNLHVAIVGRTADDIEGFERSRISGQLLRHPSVAQNICVQIEDFVAVYIWLDGDHYGAVGGSLSGVGVGKAIRYNKRWKGKLGGSSVIATCLIAFCERIGPDLIALHVLPKLKELFDELVFSQETRIASGTLERSSKVTKPKSGEDEIESLWTLCSFCILPLRLFLVWRNLARVVPHGYFSSNPCYNAITGRLLIVQAAQSSTNKSTQFYRFFSHCDNTNPTIHLIDPMASTTCENRVEYNRVEYRVLSEVYPTDPPH